MNPFSPEAWTDLPKGENLTSRVVIQNSEVLGGSSSVTKVYVGQKDGVESVAVKVVKQTQNSDQDYKDIVQYAVFMATYPDLKHPNILPCLGFCKENNEGYNYGIISPMLVNIGAYIASHEPNSHALHTLLRGVGSGLAYLYRIDVIHGALHPGNVLIDEMGRARLTDFGRTSLLTKQGVNILSICGTHRYLAPELIPEQGRAQQNPSQKSDIFSYAVLIFEVLTRTDWTATLSNEFSIPQWIKGGRHPNRDNTNGLIQDAVWDSLLSCWITNPSDRPSLNQVMVVL